MRIRTAILWALGCILLGSASAQDVGTAAIRKGARELGVWGGGGSGVGHSSDTQIASAGLRLGKVLTGVHGFGPLSGNLEYAVDIVPLYLFFQDPAIKGAGRQTVYGASITPVGVKWNFISGKNVAPFVAIEGSAIFTSRNVPAGDTSRVNFASGVASGVQIFTAPKRALTLSAHVMHISNASLGNHNPGVNVAVQVRVGYQWWK